MNKRQLCLAYIVKNYKQWPATYTLSPSAATHHGYRWCKPEANGAWVLLQGNQGDVITQEDYLKEYDATVRMSDLFDTECYGQTTPFNEGDIKITFSAEQFRAMSVAIRYHDGMKAKLNHARNALRQLTTELGE